MKFSTLLSDFFVIALMFLTIITISESAPLPDEVIEPRESVALVDNQVILVH
ncbi:7064_t:CDS:2, partial [Acaulospora morrowiae]